MYIFVLGSTTFPSAQSTAATVAAAQWRYHSVLRGRYILKSIRNKFDDEHDFTYLYRIFLCSYKLWEYAKNCGYYVERYINKRKKPREDTKHSQSCFKNILFVI